MLKTFNCGIGLVLVVAAGRAAAIEALLADAGETVVRLGRVEPGQGVAWDGLLA
jgi:phosphoribosylformylglycinamidine cyclo-ligase